MHIDIITIFPTLFERVFDFGMIAQGRKKGLLKIATVDIRAFCGSRRTVDDRPYGGGEGMVLKPEPIFRAVETCKKNPAGASSRVVLLTPKGKVFDQSKAKELSLQSHVILVCGRYEDVDQRVADHLADEELSVGDFILSGGEFAALIVADAVSRLVPGVVGKGGSILEDSFMEGMLDHPHYTRPARFRNWRVPKLLLSGDHEKIRVWREQAALETTRMRRPDLMGKQPAREDAATRKAAPARSSRH